MFATLKNVASRRSSIAQRPISKKDRDQDLENISYQNRADEGDVSLSRIVLKIRFNELTPLEQKNRRPRRYYRSLSVKADIHRIFIQKATAFKVYQSQIQEA